MAQTIRLTANATLTLPKLYLWDLDGNPVGDVTGYALTEVVSGLYVVTTVADSVNLENTIGELRTDGTSIGTDMILEVATDMWWCGTTVTYLAKGTYSFTNPSKNLSVTVSVDKV